MNVEWTEWFRWLSALWTTRILTLEGRAVAVGNIVLALVFVTLGLWGARRAVRLLSRRFLSRLVPDPASQATLETLSFYLAVVFLILFGLTLANIPLTVFTVVGGALAIGVGFGSQNVLNNFISGLILLIERPIKIGDYVEVDELFGRVERIGFRSTEILAFGNRHIIVPNSTFLEKNVLNWTHMNKLVRVKVSVGVAYGSPTEKVKELLLRAVSEEERALADPEPIVLFKNFGESSLDFELVLSIELNALRDMDMVASNLRFSIDRLFRENGIVISFPQRDVHLDALKPIEVRLLRPDAL